VANTVEQRVYEHLTEDGEFVAKFPGGVHLTSAPQGSKLPRLVFWQVDDPNDKRFLCLHGGQARIQLDVWSDNKYDVVELRTDVKTKMRTLRGADGIYVMYAKIANEFTREMTDEELFRGVVDVIVEWQEA